MGLCPFRKPWEKMTCVFWDLKNWKIETGRGHRWHFWLRSKRSKKEQLTFWGQCGSRSLGDFVWSEWLNPNLDTFKLSVKKLQNNILLFQQNQILRKHVKKKGGERKGREERFLCFYFLFGPHKGWGRDNPSRTLIGIFSILFCTWMFLTQPNILYLFMGK